ncbi:tetratricopeptide repeat protein [Streptomyces sp. 71268]|uniref:ATP-binding protein n=1 Tax=Streptomyces sp. 71268 TaxID=3002640 RepID=UPI0023F859ED|nr:tetratricopeptide repeat protein [Streptomyces sp. 71268]WEV27985.1 tetratricopeptide repeat protein [Streptomyces sp. 71268]
MTSRPHDPPQPHLVQNATSHGHGQVIQVAGDLHQSTHPACTPGPLPSLPREVSGFTGREDELRSLLREATEQCGATVVSVVDGMAGVGKTAFVIHAAHLLAKHFPDGQLFLRLHAHTPGQRPVDSSELLASLLTLHGVPAQLIPAHLDARSALWRAQLSGKKTLIVLDDAVDSAQIEPLLPGTGNCLALVTSRRRLLALDNATSITLAPLPTEQGVRLLHQLAHRTPEPSELASAAGMVRQCGNLPLAIAVLAGRLAHHPKWSITQLAANFAAARDRLSELRVPGRAVAAAFDLSYAALPPEQRRLFRSLSSHIGPDFDAYATAALNNIRVEQARHGLELLYADHLIDELTPGRFRMHDLIRAYAEDRRKAEDTPATRCRSLDRLLDYYQGATAEADWFLRQCHHGSSPPGGTRIGHLPQNRDEALAWMRRERATLIACIDFARAQSDDARVVTLTASMAVFLRHDGPWPHVASLHRAAVAAARRCGAQRAEAHASYELACARAAIGDYQEAVQLHERALAWYQGAHDTHGAATTLRELGRMRSATSDYPAAARLQEQALSAFRSIGDRRCQAVTLGALGRVRDMTGDLSAAAALQEQALTLCREARDQAGEAVALHDLGRVWSAMGDHAQGAELLEQALVHHQRVGDQGGEATVLSSLGRTRRQLGNHEAAALALTRARQLASALGDVHGEANAVYGLGRVRSESGDLGAAAQLILESAALFRTLGDRLGQANAAHAVGRVGAAAGDISMAREQLSRAAAMFRALGDTEREAAVLRSMERLLTT